MSSFLYRLGRLAAQRRRSVLAVWLVVLALAGGGALFTKGTDDTFAIPGTQSQDALDYLGRVFPETSGSSVQLVIVVPPGQDVTQLAAAPSADAVEAINKLDQVASVINPFDPNPAGQTAAGESPRIHGAVSEDRRAAIVSAQLTVALAGVKPDTRTQLTVIGADLSRAIGHGTSVHVGGPAFSNPVPKLSPTEGIGLLIALIVLLMVFRSLLAAGMPLLTAILGVGISVALIYTATLVTPVSSTAPTFPLHHPVVIIIIKNLDHPPPSRSPRASVKHGSPQPPKVTLRSGSDGASSGVSASIATSGFQ